MTTVFQFIADFLHLFSVLHLLTNLIRRKSCGGISGKTQVLFALVYSARYLDVWTNYITIYNSAFKITYIILHSVIVVLIFVIFRKSYRKTEDTFFTELLLIPCFLLSLQFNYDMTFTEVMWSFSIFLEAVAILPQVYMICRQREVEKSLLYYMVPLGLYRLFYIFHWIYRYCTDGYFEMISNTAGAMYVFVYICALIGFFLWKIKIDNDCNNVLSMKMFSARGRVCDNETKIDTKKLRNEQLLVEKV
ncbi:ER lumen protein-retaining receptor-like [Anoplophora glabripennis]|uniref:ER lumen protein-retaining receptor-like n=1 Tax=Anoplophora glabripennis TaxID=217634 RepID=UPI0008758FFE|nr:ER lumen protein-retaining receptor-like [Anoplophora glabripennis]